jgi:hypothetical protein
MTEEMKEKSILDYGFEQEEYEPTGLTELGLRILQEFVAGRYIEVAIEEDDMVLSAMFWEGSSGDLIELGRVNLYHAVGFTADRLADLKDEKALSDMATLFRNIATLIDQTAMTVRYPNSGEFFASHVVPQIAPREAEEDEDDQNSDDDSNEELPAN